MSRTRVFVKLGGSFVTDKAVADSLKGPRIAAAARMMVRALEAARASREPLSLVLGHGAGSYGHILAARFDAVRGVHPEHGWEAVHRIRESMTRMNLLFVKHCARGGLFPVTVSPFATTVARDGRLERIDTGTVRLLLGHGQIALIHGDVVCDRERGFTIASTETLLEGLSRTVRFDRIVMVSDTDGVLDGQGRTVELIDRRSIKTVARFLGGSGSPDVTGGMLEKVEMLFSLVCSGRAGEARIVCCHRRPRNLCEAMLGAGGGGTVIRP